MSDPWVVGYLLPNGALVCLNCSKGFTSQILNEAMYNTDPEIAIDNADCDRCGEPMHPEWER